MQYNETPTYPGHTPAKKSRRWVRPVAFSAAGVLTLFIGVGIGASGSDAPADAKPAPTATVTAEPIVETETVTETVEVTPEACLDAIDYADDLILTMGDVGLLAAQYIDLIPRAFEAGMDYDIAASEQIIADMDELTAQVEDMDVATDRANYDAAVEECRGA